MTKKRFIKLLMSTGVQRNKARQMALSYNSQNIPYANALDFYVSTTVSGVFRALGEALEGVTIAMSKVVQSFKNFTEAINVEKI